jgi:hypothetical protein
MHPSDDPIRQFFAYSHLPSGLQEISKPFGDMADWIVGKLPRNPERTVALRKLLEAKDAAVRARLFDEPVREKPTVAELEAILNSDDGRKVEILPDGSVQIVDTLHQKPTVAILNSDDGDQAWNQRR